MYRRRVYDTASPWKKKGGWRELTWGARLRFDSVELGPRQSESRSRQIE